MTASPKLALVTGGRRFKATWESRNTLVEAMADVVLVIEGEARGFDRFVRDVARGKRIDVQTAPALWNLAKALAMPTGAEGPKRNRRMRYWADELAEQYGLDIVLIAGPGGTGTADMRRVCDDLEVREIPGMLEGPR